MVVGQNINTKEVWEKMKSGDEQSLSDIFTIYYSDLYKYGFKIYNHPDLVKDSIQDVFLRIWEKRNTIGDVQNPKAYLISSVRRKLFSNLEARAYEDSEELLKNYGNCLFSFSTNDFIELEETTRQIKNVLVQTINSLPERQRELIFLRFYYNLKYLEIARILEVNEQTIRNLMQRALSNLRLKIDRNLFDGIDNVDDLLLTLFVLFQKINTFG